MDLSSCKIKEFLNDDLYIDITVLESVDSTNKYLKEKALNGHKDISVVIADMQTGGRGRFTRKFYSPSGCGIYMSILLKPAFLAKDAVLITAAAAVAVSDAIEVLSGKKAKIKWVNDIYVDNKKVCGILTEGAVKPDGYFDFAVLGIGINVFEPDGGFDDEIKDIAGAIFDEKVPNLRNKLAADIVNRFFEFYKEFSKKTFLESYREKSLVIGKEITVIKNEQKKNAVALGIDDDCRLQVEYEDKTKEYLFSGEISIKI